MQQWVWIASDILKLVSSSRTHQIWHYGGAHACKRWLKMDEILTQNNANLSPESVPWNDLIEVLVLCCLMHKSPLQLTHQLVACRPLELSCAANTCMKWTDKMQPLKLTDSCKLYNKMLQIFSILVLLNANWNSATLFTFAKDNLTTFFK